MIAQAILSAIPPQDTTSSTTTTAITAAATACSTANTDSNTNTAVGVTDDEAGYIIDELFPSTPTSINSNVNSGSGSTSSNTDNTSSTNTNTYANINLPIITPELYAQIPHTMIFANEVETVQILSKKLNQLGLTCVEYHKLLLPSIKSNNIEGFYNGIYKILICTDSASRGLDLPYVKHIIQSEFATNVVQYLHRIGRCSRGGKTGQATNFYEIGTSSEVLVQTILNNNLILSQNYDPLEEGEEPNVSSFAEALAVDARINSNTPSTTTTPTTTTAHLRTDLTRDVSRDTTPSTPVVGSTKEGVQQITGSINNSVAQAFSRRRGLRKKMKKAILRIEEREESDKRINTLNNGGSSDNNDLESYLEEVDEVLGEKGELK